jgi:hypothetical protein
MEGNSAVPSRQIRAWLVVTSELTRAPSGLNRLRAWVYERIRPRRELHGPTEAAPERRENQRLYLTAVGLIARVG